MVAGHRVVLDRAVGREIRRLAAAGYPKEACGVLVGTSNAGVTRVSAVHPARNLEAERPGDRYRLDPKGFLVAHRAARTAAEEVVGFWHSHPDHSPQPSSTDLEAAWEGYAYLIVSVSGEGPGELRCWRLAAGGFVEEPVDELEE